MATKVAELLDSVPDDPEVIKAAFKIVTVHPEKQLVTGQVYAPNVLDTHGHYMEPDEVVLTAHRFMAEGRLRAIDVQHDNSTIDAVVVESFIARKDDPTFDEGSWVVTTKILDPEAWQMIKAGELNGYSFEILTHKDDVEVEVEYQSWYYGFTDADPIDGHDHPFLLKLADADKVTWGQTGLGSDGSPAHTISKLSVTDPVVGKTHRIHLN